MAEIVTALDSAAGSKGYRCAEVSWEDSQRATTGGFLSCWGGNISDVRLWEKSGKKLFTLRSQNWNERLGFVGTSDIAVVVDGPGAEGGSPTLESVTLESYLRSMKHATYAGLRENDLTSPRDSKVSIRFQTVFLPIADSAAATAPPPSTEFCTEVYNYNTRDDEDPRNLLLLCTPQGTAVQQDGAGAKRVYYHAVDEKKTIHRYWLEAERSTHAVGAEQKETQAEATAAAARGKSTAIVIGVPGMGTRFNVQILIQVPLKQKPKPLYSAYDTMSMPESGYLMLPAVTKGLSFGAPTKKPCAAKKSSATKKSYEFDDCDEEAEEGWEYQSFCCFDGPPTRSYHPAPSKKGTSNAARVSRGSEVDTWGGLTKKDPQRDHAQHITATVTMYYTVAGGVPSELDIAKAIADLDTLYANCNQIANLTGANKATGGNFTAPLDATTATAIVEKVAEQPYKPPVFAPASNNGFPK